MLVMPEHLSIERRQIHDGLSARRSSSRRRKAAWRKHGTWPSECATRAAASSSINSPIPDNPRAHYEGTGPEIWRDTGGTITHLVSSMGTTGTIMGCSRYFKEKNPRFRSSGCQPEEGSQFRHPQMAGSLSAENLRCPACGPDHARVPDRGGGNDPAIGARGGYFRRYFVRRRAGRCAQNIRRDRKRYHCVDRMRPRGSLSFHRCFPGLVMSLV